MFGMGIGEIVLVGVIALFFVGPKKIPELAKGLGEGIGSFKKALRDEGQK
ncbi:MAG: twin-arginine translocase TatA/TatE family subunit [Bdellovibrionales bacterium]|jgi:sec-independent protein translocase protein TatA|nr:twin-arginine translocase TatA/TatE family subunit [Bdellovibrionales bacterium]